MSTHKQVRVRANGEEELIDEGIAPLIEAIWRAGIETYMSCEKGYDGLVWLCFACPLEANRFVSAISVYEKAPGSFYRRMIGWGRGSTEEDWRYEIRVEDYDLTVDDDADCSHQPGGLDLQVSIRFPPADIPIVLERLLAHNRLSKGKGL